MFIDNPNAPEFYPRRIYARTGPDPFCVMNNAAAPAWRDWEAATGIEGLITTIRAWHQPSGDGTRENVADVAWQMIERAVEYGHLVGEPERFCKREDLEESVVTAEDAPAP